MSKYPNEIFTPRVLQNRPDSVFDETKTKVIYAEDLNKKDDEIVAIEEILGVDPNGSFGTVKAWLTELSTFFGFIADTSNTTIPASTTTIPTFTHIIEDVNNLFNGSVFTVPTGKGGRYRISGTYTFSNVNNAYVFIVGLAVNGTALTHVLGRGIAGGPGICGEGGSIVLKLNAGDTVCLGVFCTNATVGYNPIPGYCTFSAYRLPFFS